MDSSAIYILARGQQANGKITVVQEMTDSNEITVDVAAEDRDRDVFRGTAVCLMERKEGERGVGIFVSIRLPDASYVLISNKKTPKHLTWSNRRTDIEITVKIPHLPAGPVPEIHAFEITAPDFQVTLQNTDEFVTFRNFIIRAQNVPVAVGVS